MSVAVWGATDVGLKRDNNQDSILINQDLGLFIVADGMGGHKGGEVASDLAIHTAQGVIEKKQGRGSVRDLISLAYKEASGRIFHKAKVENPELRGMGTTMVLAYIHRGEVYFANVGDSRAYLLSEGGFWQITEDHSLVNEQIRQAGGADLLDENELLGKNVITRSVGFQEVVEPDIYARNLKKGEGYLLCSDGLSGLVSNERIFDIVENTPDKEVASLCIEEAKRAGGDDNISVVFFRVQ